MPTPRTPNDLVQRIKTLRRFGQTTVGFTPNTDSASDLSTALDVIVAGYGMRGCADWIEIDAQEAERLIVTILNKDLAYGVEVMPVNQANLLAAAFMEPFRVSGRYFTNGTFHKPGNPDGWTPLTDATFDTGVVALGPTVAGILWVQDED